MPRRIRTYRLRRLVPFIAGTTLLVQLLSGLALCSVAFANFGASDSRDGDCRRTVSSAPMTIGADGDAICIITATDSAVVPQYVKAPTDVSSAIITAPVDELLPPRVRTVLTVQRGPPLSFYDILRTVVLRI